MITQQQFLHAVCQIQNSFSTDKFSPYQVWMSNTLQNNSAVLLGAFMGAGKTAVTLHAYVENRRKKNWGKALIIAPLAVANDTWPTEIEKWAFANDLTYTVVTGLEKERKKHDRADVDIYIVNRENVKWLATHHTHEWFKQFSVIIYDEASRLKSGEKETKTGNYTGFYHLWTIKRLIPNIWLLSGTPAPNGAIDLWGPVFMLDNGERLGFNKTDFLMNHFNHNEFRRTYEPKDGANEVIMNKIRDIMFVLKEEDYITLPDLHVIDRVVKLAPDILKRYKEFARERIMEELNVEAVNTAVLASKLLQFANGSVYETLDTTDPSYKEGQKPKAQYVHDRKIQELESVIEEAMGRPVLIAYSYKFDVYAIKKKFPWIRVFGETKNDVKDWNAGKLKAMVMHPQSAGHGLNLQHGGNIAVWFGLTWSLEYYLQFNKRLHRRGQENSVKLYRILAHDTYDMRVSQVLNQKDITQNELIENVRVYGKQIQQ